MVHLCSADITGLEIDISAEEEGDGDPSVADEYDTNRLPPASDRRNHRIRNVAGSKAGGQQFRPDPVPHDGVVFTSLTGDPCPDGSGRLLSHPDMNQAAQLDDPEENRQ